MIRVSKPKNKMPIVGLNSSSSKTNRTKGIKLLNLETPGHVLSALKNKPWRFRHFFCIDLFIYLTSATLCVGSSYVFSGIFYEFVKKIKSVITLKRLKVETGNLDLG